MSLTDLARKTLRAIMDACARNPVMGARVKADPKAAPAEEGVNLPFDEVEAVEDTPETVHIALAGLSAEPSDGQVDTIVGGESTVVWGGWLSDRQAYDEEMRRRGWEASPID